MSATSAAAPSTSAFRRLAITEARLFIREPVGLFWGLAFPIVLLVIVGAIPSSREPSHDLGGLRFIDVYVPVLIAFVFGMLALNALPPVLAGYREKGVLRRLSTTPVAPWRLLAAQLAVQGAVAALALVAILAVGRIAFSVALPGQVLGFLVAVVLAAAALLALGVLIAALAPSARAANGAGALLFFPMMFFAGLWLPRAQMPALLRHISDATPLGSAAQAIGDTMAGHWPHALALGVMAAWALASSAAAVRMFRWE